MGVKVSRDDQKKMFPTCSSKERYEDVFVSLALALCRRVSKKNNFWITNPTNDHLNITLYRHKQRMGGTRKKGLEENEEENDEKIYIYISGDFPYRDGNPIIPNQTIR